MAAPTFAELQQIRDEVPASWGEAFSDAEVFLAFSRTESVTGTILALVSRRYGEMLATPDTFSIPGEYSQSNGNAIAALREQYKRVLANHQTYLNETEGLAAVRVREIVRSNGPGR